ncbi:MAG: translocation protein TolB, partial [Bacteroidota bacterium]
MHRFLPPHTLKLAWLAIFIGFPFLTQAQQAAQTFGKNRIQYQNFEWKYYSTGDFDLYFYQGGSELAEQAVKFLKVEFERITDILGYVPLAKTKIFLYNSHSDLMQSNIGINDNYQAVAGETVFVKNVVEIAYPGTLEAFKTELVFQVATKLLQEMMFGGSLTDMFQKAYLLNLPDWFIPGAARYIAYGWGPRMDDYARDLVSNGRVRKLDRYQGEEAALLGQSIWNYIAEKYGRSNISSVLNLTRIIRNEERSIANTLGTTFARFKVGWVSYYQEQAQKVLEDYEYPGKQYLVTRRNRRNIIRNRVSLSPDGRYLAYSENDRGRYNVILLDREADKQKVILRGGYKLLNQQPNEDLPILAWQDSVTLVMAAERGGGPSLWIYDVNEKEKQQVSLAAFHAIQHISFNDNGRLMAMSAEEDGRSDIYLVSLRRNQWRKLTDDAYDDEYPEFVPGTNAIVFSSNRSSDTLRAVPLEDVKDDLITFNLFVYNLDTTSTVLSRITNTLSTDIYPIPVNQDEYYYLSDQKGIQNLFRYHRTDSLYTQITNFANSLHGMSINLRTSELAYIAELEGKDYIYLQPLDFTQQRFTLPTARQQRQQAKYLANRLMAARARQNLTLSAPISETTPKEDTAGIDTNELLDPDDYTFGNPEETPMVGLNTYSSVSMGAFGSMG